MVGGSRLALVLKSILKTLLKAEMGDLVLLELSLHLQDLLAYSGNVKGGKAPRSLS